MPCENVRTRASAACASPTLASTARRASSDTVSAYMAPANRRFSRAVSSSYRGGRSDKRPTRRRMASPSVRVGKPNTRTSPSVGRAAVARIRRRVLLPEPLGPSSATASPAGIARSIPRSAQVRPNRLPRPVVSTAATPLGEGALRSSAGELLKAWPSYAGPAGAASRRRAASEAGQEPQLRVPAGPGAVVGVDDVQLDDRRPEQVEPHGEAVAR